MPLISVPVRSSLLPVSVNSNKQPKLTSISSLQSISQETNPHEFFYDRSIPSIRWPHLHLKPDNLKPDNSTLHPKAAKPNPDIPKPKPEPEPETVPEIEVEVEVEVEVEEPIQSKQSRTQTKKMTKLALKRAKDWRERIQFLTNQILSLPDSSAVANVLDSSIVQMTPTDYAFLVKSVGSASWRRSLEVFEWLTLKKSHSPFPRLLAAVIAVLGKNGQESIAEDVFARCIDGSEPSIQVYNAMMGVYARLGNFKKVQELISLVKDKGLEPDLVSFNTLINARAKAHSMGRGKAVELLDEVKKSGLRPDTITYNTLISACAYSSNVVDAVSVFTAMEESKCCPDLWTYNAMMAVYGRSGLIREVEGIFLELKEMGFSPDAVTFNSLLYAYALEGDVNNAKKVCNEMVKSGFRKDEITYNTIIHMYGKRGDVESALELYDEMKEIGCKPDAVTFTVLIDTLGKVGRISEAGKVMEDLVRARVKPTLKTFSALICGYAKAGMREQAERTFGLMVRSGIKPDCLAYSVVIDVLLRCGEIKKSLVMYRSMIKDGFMPDSGLYEVMIAVLMRGEKNEEIDEIVKDMDEICMMNPVVMSEILIKGGCISVGAQMMKKAVIQGFELNNENLVAVLNAYSQLEKHEEASSLLSFISENSSNSFGFVLEAKIGMLCKENKLESALMEYNISMGYDSKPFTCSFYASVIASCIEKKFFSEASQLFSDMKLFGLKPNQSIYESMITAYCNINFPETAHCLIEEAKRVGISFDDHSIYVNLIETYGKMKLWQKAESFVGMLRLHTTVDRKIWNALIYAYAESGLYEKGRAIFNTMMKHGPQPSIDSVNGLMKALIIDGRLNELYVLVEELQDMDFKISKSTILMILDAFVREGNIFEVKKIYNGMKAAGYLPTMHLYRSIIGLFTRATRVRDVELLVSEMKESGFKPDLVIFNLLLKMYTKIEDFRKASEVYKNIQGYGFSPDEDTYNTLIVMYSRDLRPEEGFTLLNEMVRKGIEPKLDSYKSILSACSKERLWDQAEELFNSMRSKGYKLDRSFYHIMMKIYRNSGDHLKAENLLSLMKEDGIEPTIATMHMLMVSYSDGGKPEEAEKVLDNLKHSSQSLTTLPYTSVIDAYLKQREYDVGISKLLDMKNDGVEPDHRIWTCFIRAASFCKETENAINLLNSLGDTGFDLPLRFLTEKSESLFTELDILLDKLIPEEDNACFNFVNALEDVLWAFQKRATASWVFQLAIKKGIYSHDVFRVAEQDWGADFRKLSGGAALVGLTLWLDHMQDASLHGSPESQKSVALITGTAEYNMVSLNNTLKIYLWEMGSPFLPCKTRSGVLVAKAHSLRMWLKDSTFCMDLELKDSLKLPESNSMMLTEGYFMRAALFPAFKMILERLGNVRPKKFARLALLSEESRDKVITRDIEGRIEKMEKMKKKGIDGPRRPTRLRRGKVMRRKHKAATAASKR